MNKILMMLIIFIGTIVSYIILINLIAKIDISSFNNNTNNLNSISDSSATITGLSTSTAVSFSGKRFYGYFEGTSDSKGRTVNAYLLNAVKLPLETKTMDFRKTHEIFFTIFPILFIMVIIYIFSKNQIIKRRKDYE